MPLSAYDLDRFVAPDISKFTKASILDMSDTSKEQEYWVRNLVTIQCFCHFVFAAGWS